MARAFLKVRFCSLAVLFFGLPCLDHAEMGWICDKGSLCRADTFAEVTEHNGDVVVHDDSAGRGKWSVIFSECAALFRTNCVHG